MCSSLSIGDTFRVNHEAMACFGFSGRWRRALWQHPRKLEQFLWFAYLGEYGGRNGEVWGENTLGDDGTTFRDFRTANIIPDPYASQGNEIHERLLFTRNQQFVRGLPWIFRGVFVVDSESNRDNTSAWTRISDAVDIPSGNYKK